MKTNEITKRRTIRLSSILDNELNAIAKKNKISVNKLIADFIKYNINNIEKANAENDLYSINENIKIIKKEIEDLQKKYYWLNALTKQIFANSGFVRNRDINSDPTFNDFVNNRFKEKYDTKFNA